MAFIASGEETVFMSRKHIKRYRVVMKKIFTRNNYSVEKKLLHY